MDKDILGLGNALTDVIINIQDEGLEELNLKKGCACSSSIKKLEKILKEKEKEIKFIPGGSPSNTIVNASQLCTLCGLIGAVGKDDIGSMYHKDLSKNDVLDYVSDLNGKSGRCYILVTPDGERTMVTDIGVAGSFRIPFDIFNEYRIFHTSAYELRSNKTATLEAMKHARKNKLIVSFDMADPFIIEKIKKDIQEALNYTDMLFGNEQEVKALTDLSPEQAIGELADLCGIAVIKKGAEGSLIKSKNDKMIDIKGYLAKNFVNTNGAGDAYAAGFLNYFLNKNDLTACGMYGSLVAAQVCEREGARLS